MKPRKWVKPALTVNQFTSDESVSACFYTYCYKAHGDGFNGGTRPSYGTFNGFSGYYDSNDSPNETHSASACGDQNHYSINPANGSGVEYSSDQGALPIQNLSISDTNGDGKLGAGDWASWYTYSADRTRHWYHYGQLSAEDATHPNRS